MPEDVITGRIHSFETLGAVDGPGLRFIVFMQGCPLKCKFCHNRDTWDTCGGIKYLVEDVIKKIKRCKPYLDASKGGGITVSGGEPLLQVDFVTKLFEEVHKLGLTTCLDTAGSIKIDEKIKKLLSITDLVLLDIKHINNEKSINLTGLSNKNELEFAKYLSDNGINMWIRQVLVPGYTDNEEDLKETRKFIDSLKTVKKVEILPYHNFGREKWIKLGLEYPLEKVLPPTEEQIKKAKNILYKK